MAYLAGDTLTEHITLINPDGTPILGATFPAEDRVSVDPNGAPFPATVTELGQGLYRVDYTTPRNAAAGEWFIKLRADDANRQVFSVRWDVIGKTKLYLPGDTLTYTFAVLDSANNDVTGATFPPQFRHAVSPLGESFAYTIDEIGKGVYRITAATAKDAEPGKWVVRLQDDQSPPNIYEAEWQVLSRAQISVIYTPSFQGYTRRELRRMVMSKVGDLTLSTATANSGSSTWVDRLNVVGDAGRYAGREILITAGTPGNIGQVRYVSGSSKQGTLQFSDALPFPVFAGDEAEIINTRGGGFTFQEVHRALDHCLAVARIQTPIMAEAGSFAVTERDIPIPSEFSEIDTVQYKDPDDDETGWRTLHSSRSRGTDGWHVDHANRTLVISGRSGHWIDGMDIRIYGWGLAPPLVNDDDMIDVHPEWIVNAAAAFLLLQAIGTPRALTPDWERKGNYFQQIADSLIDRTRPRRRPNSVKV